MFIGKVPVCMYIIYFGIYVTYITIKKYNILCDTYICLYIYIHTHKILFTYIRKNIIQIFSIFTYINVSMGISYMLSIHIHKHMNCTYKLHLCFNMYSYSI